jgi:hypothetical protein
MRTRNAGSDNTAMTRVLIAGSVLVILVAALVIGLPWVVTVLAVAVAAVVGTMIGFTTSSNQHRDTLRWQEAAVAVADWAARNDGRSETDATALAGLPLADSKWFTGSILAVGHHDGFAVGVTCFEEPEAEGATTRQTAVLVHLPNPHDPSKTRSVEVSGQELRMVSRGWPPSVDLDAHVGAAVAAAREL